MAEFIKVTEQSSLYDNLEQMSVTDLLTNLNNEDQKVALAVRESIPVMAALVEKIVERMEKG
ncbi:MAG: N-acetylmuramic acid 6-phosphate etherase, partial [Rikenellaceae bacterium]|nr:N-acetylmuramic acid 6-phosphate etherase [Rikenellaceae bacterium]MBQ5609953.1 N-acetylmuramic acid 6-phosphate etherase [Rikenellaceae bacterium]MBQ5893778.1 N-acetylmuramic acid 6-phosphate etherase [Rikenellaceae bacterium]MBQ5893876.1 N-acetylmuramic acid 6-phosphate etherase [Rikenellaceae bacterium]